MPHRMEFYKTATSPSNFFYVKYQHRFCPCLGLPPLFLFCLNYLKTSACLSKIVFWLLTPVLVSARAINLFYIVLPRKTQNVHRPGSGQRRESHATSQKSPSQPEPSLKFLPPWAIQNDTLFHIFPFLPHAA